MTESCFEDLAAIASLLECDGSSNQRYEHPLQMSDVQHCAVLAQNREQMHEDARTLYMHVVCAQKSTDKWPHQSLLKPHMQLEQRLHGKKKIKSTTTMKVNSTYMSEGQWRDRKSQALDVFAGHCAFHQPQQLDSSSHRDHSPLLS